MRVHALAVKEIVLLLERHLRKAGVACTCKGTEGSPRGSANPSRIAAADRAADPCSQRRGEKSSPHVLVGSGIGLRRGLRCGVLLTGSLIGSKRVK
jgi:hypothetical protein